MLHRSSVASSIASSIALLALIVSLTAARLPAAQSPQIPLPAGWIAQFVQPLPGLSIPPQNGTVTTVFGNQRLNFRMCEFRADAVRIIWPLGVPSRPYNGTWVWGYLVDPTGDTPCSTLISLYANANGLIDTYTGPVVVSTRNGGATDVKYFNNLGNAATTNVLAYKYSTDQTLHWADPLSPWPDANQCEKNGGIPPYGSFCAQNYEGPVPAVPHLHGGEVPAEIDGGPDSWFTSDGLRVGHKYYSFGGNLAKRWARYRYANTQEAAPIWFHDHTLGVTRLNVYAGLAGAYLIDDPNLGLPPNFPPLSSVVPLVIQDRQFDLNGQLFFQADDAGGTLWATNPEHPYWKPELIGDAIVVNGKAWPYLNVQPRRYTFLFLNGSNARSYRMYLQNPDTGAYGPPMWVIATDGGYLDKPVRIDPISMTSSGRLLQMPGERYMITIDFSGFAPGTKIQLKNDANAPFPGGTPVDPNTTAKIIQFNVVPCAPTPCPVDTSFDPAAAGAEIRPAHPIVRLVDPVHGTLAPGVTLSKTRQLTLNEVTQDGQWAIDPVTGQMMWYPGGPLQVLVNNTNFMGDSTRTYGDFTPITVNGVTTKFSELPNEGQTELWEIVNLTADAHPIHLHLVQFQLMNRQELDTTGYGLAYGQAFPSGAYQPAFGPPLDYRAANNPQSGGKDGGNPNVNPYLASTSGGFHVPNPWEAGWKDTVVAKPNQVTRVVARWSPTDLPVSTPTPLLYFPFDPSGGNNSGAYSYVWHCHIIDHEDNEMMRPDTVRLNPLAPPPDRRPLRRGIDY